MSHVTALRCRECDNEYEIEPTNACELCFGPLEVSYDYDAIAKNISREKIRQGPATMWRYHDFLPVDPETAVDLGTGFTSLLKADNLGRRLGLDKLYIKNDAANPTNSFKDRPVTVTASKALEFEFDILACPSTGNLMGSVAAHGAKAGMKTVVFYPADLERGKIIQAAAYGPTLVAVDGTYDQINRLCSELADSYAWAFVNINMRPYYAEGSKTLGYEVAEQLGWQAPAHCVVPLASGALFTKIWKGLHEFASLGLIPEVRTRMHITQPAGNSPIVKAFEADETRVRPVKPNTIAKSLAIGNPADGLYALQTVRESSGAATAVPEDDIVNGIKLLAQTEGIFTETAGGVAISGLKRLVERGAIKRDEPTVVFVTGNGLKTLEAVEDVAQPISIAPTIASFEEALGGA